MIFIKRSSFHSFNLIGCFPAGSISHTNDVTSSALWIRGGGFGGQEAGGTAW